MSAAVTPQPGIMDIEAYVPGESDLPGGIKPIKLSSNETPLGASPEAVAAYGACAGLLARYPDGQAARLRDAIAQRHGLEADRIVCGAGSDELLNLLAHAYLGPGDEGLFTEHGFLVYRIAILAAGATPVVAEERDFTANVDAILDKVSSKTKVVFLANPNNPTGTYLPLSEVQRLRQALPENVLLVLDAAYAEYVTAEDYEAGAALVKSTSNTVMTRTFSKIHGLAALRIGWAYCPPAIADVLNRIRGPFNLTASAIAAGAAAMADETHIATSVAHNTAWLGWLNEEITKAGLTVTPSVANFLLIHFPKDDPARSADACDAFLKSKGIILRKVGGYGLPNCLRLTIGTEAENQAVVAGLTLFMKASQS